MTPRRPVTFTEAKIVMFEATSRALRRPLQFIDQARTQSVVDDLRQKMCSVATGMTMSNKNDAEPDDTSDNQKLVLELQALLGSAIAPSAKYFFDHYHGEHKAAVKEFMCAMAMALTDNGVLPRRRDVARWL